LSRGKVSARGSGAGRGGKNQPINFCSLSRTGGRLKHGFFITDLLREYKWLYQHASDARSRRPNLVMASRRSNVNQSGTMRAIMEAADKTDCGDRAGVCGCTQICWCALPAPPDPGRDLKEFRTFRCVCTRIHGTSPERLPDARFQLGFMLGDDGSARSRKTARPPADYDYKRRPSPGRTVRFRPRLRRCPWKVELGCLAAGETAWAGEEDWRGRRRSGWTTGQMLNGPRRSCGLVSSSRRMSMRLGYRHSATSHGAYSSQATKPAISGGNDRSRRFHARVPKHPPVIARVGLRWPQEWLRSFKNEYGGGHSRNLRRNLSKKFVEGIKVRACARSTSILPTLPFLRSTGAMRRNGQVPR